MKLSTAARLSDMYPDRHLNVFVPYETHDLDYNVTRALICTLKWSDPSLVRSFLTKFFNAEIAAETGVLYDLQACDYEDFDPESCKQKFMLGVSREGTVSSRLPSVDNFYRPGVLNVLRNLRSDPVAQLNAVRELAQNSQLTFDDLEVLLHTLEEYEQGSMPDGWIFTEDGTTCVLIEAKLTQLLDQHQLDRHSETWFGEAARGDSLVLLKWSDVASFAKSNASHADPRTGFLCQQLFEYLEILGTAEFESFKPFDFDSDSLHLGLPKVENLIGSVAKAAFDKGLPVSDKTCRSGMSVRVAWSDPSLVGSIGLELAEDQLNLVYSVGHHVGTQVLSGPHGVDRILTQTDRGILNPLADIGLQSEGYKVNVERYVYREGRPIFDRSTLSIDLQPANFNEVLEELALQHPVPEERVAQQRSAVLTIVKSVEGEDTLLQRSELIERVLAAFTDFTAIAKVLSTAPQTVESESAGE